MKSATLFSVSLAFIRAVAQDPLAIFNQTGRLPAGCVSGYTAGTDTVLLTIPYTYTQVLSIIGDYQNLTWSGNPKNTVTLNGTDNTVGTARTYDTAGAHVIETITVYDKPANGPYNEVHTLAPLSVPSANVSFYGDYDGTTATPVCNGAATAFNFTANFCATNATLTAAILHMLHLADAQTVGVFLGGQNFTTCEAINSTMTSSSSTGTMSAPAATFTGGVGTISASALLAGIGSLAALVL